MINEEAFANLSTRMNFDAACHKTSKLRDPTWNEWNMRIVEGMSHTMIEDGPQTWIDNCLKDISTGRIFLKNDIYCIWPARPPAGNPAWCRNRNAWW